MDPETCEKDEKQKRKEDIERLVKLGTGIVTIATFVMNINEKRNRKRISTQTAKY